MKPRGWAVLILLVPLVYAFKVYTHQRICETAWDHVHSTEGFGNQNSSSFQSNPSASVFLFRELAWVRQAFVEGCVREDCGVDPDSVKPGADILDIQKAQLSQCFGDWDALLDSFVCANRYNNHFHHPVLEELQGIQEAGLSGRRLPFLQDARCKSSLEWALNDDPWDAFSHQPTSGSGRKWTWQGVVEARAGWTPLVWEWFRTPSLYVDPDANAVRRQRAAYTMRKLFSNLGHVTHLLVDLFQPQHVHLDMHPGSAFESFVNTHVELYTNVSNVLPWAWQTLESRLHNSSSWIQAMRQVSNFTYWTSTFTRAQLQERFVWDSQNRLWNAEGRVFLSQLPEDPDDSYETPFADHFWNVAQELPASVRTEARAVDAWFLENVVDAIYDSSSSSSSSSQPLRKRSIAEDFAELYVPLAIRTVVWFLEQWDRELFRQVPPLQERFQWLELWNQNGSCVSSIRSVSSFEPEVSYAASDRMACLTHNRSEDADAIPEEQEQVMCVMLLRLFPSLVHNQTIWVEWNSSSSSSSSYIANGGVQKPSIANSTSFANYTLEVWPIGTHGLGRSSWFPCTWYTETNATLRLTIAFSSSSSSVVGSVEGFGNNSYEPSSFETQTIPPLIPTPDENVSAADPLVRYHDMCRVYAHPNVLYTHQTTMRAPLSYVLASQLACPNYLSWLQISAGDALLSLPVLELGVLLLPLVFVML